MYLDLDDVARKRNAETIWREISGAHPFRLGDVRDPYGLIFRLWDPADAVTVKLRQKFSWSTRQQMNEYDGTPPPSEQLVCAVLGEFNQLLEGPCIYDERLFVGVELTDEALRLIRGVLESVEKIRLNRILLESVCYPSIARSAGYMQNLNTLEGWARFLLAGKEIHGEINGEAHFTPMDVALEAISQLADGRPLWEPERSKFLTFARLIMRRFVSHELEKSENKMAERLSLPMSPDKDSALISDHEGNSFDPGGDRRAHAADAEYMNIMERFHPDSVEHKVLEVFYVGKGNERPKEIAEMLGISIKEVKKAKDNVMEMLVQVNYFRDDGR